MPKRVCAVHTKPAPVTAQGLSRLGNDCLIVILSFLLASVGPEDYSKLQRWIRLQCVCKQLYEVCHSPQLMGLLNVKVGTVEVLHKLSRMSGIQRLSCEIETEKNKWWELLPKFTSLQELNLLSDVTDEVCKHVALCTGLKALYFCPQTTSSEMFQICSTLISLETLQWSYGLSDQSLKTVALFTNLHDLNISCCPHVSDEGIKVLSHLRLRTLIATYTSISDVGLCALMLGGLEKLAIHNSPITDASFSHLSSSLVSLTTGSKCLNGSAALMALTSLTELVVLDKMNNAFYQDLSMLTNLRRLELASAEFDVGALRLPRLQSLSLIMFGRTGKVRHLGSLSCLGHLGSFKLHTDFCLLDVHVDQLSVLTKLKELDLSCNCGLRDTALPIISCLKSLRSLDVSYCPNLTDENLHWIKQLPQLEVLKFVGTTMSKATVMERLPNVEWN